MAFEVEPPKYARVVRALQERIEEGAYPPGEALPSEAQLVGEFRVSRPTVVRALNILRLEGWIDSQQGKGHFVRGKPAAAGRRPPEHVDVVLDLNESAEVEMVGVGPVLVSGRLASAMGLAEGTPVIARRRVTVAEGDPVDLVSAYFPVDLTAGTVLGKPEPIVGGLRRYIETAKGVRFDHVIERTAARLARPDETTVLGISESDPVLSLLITAHDPTGAVLLAMDVVLPGDRHELEDSYPIT
ncbi:MAG TPA: GntR family transcriptional regulator [Mycobacteriales bacterium]|jgi:Transcriptional regulators